MFFFFLIILKGSDEKLVEFFIYIVNEMMFKKERYVYIWKYFLESC